MKIPKYWLEHYNMSEHEFKWRLAKHEVLHKLDDMELDELHSNGDTYKRRALVQARDDLFDKWGEHIWDGPMRKTFYEEGRDEDNSKE